MTPVTVGCRVLVRVRGVPTWLEQVEPHPQAPGWWVGHALPDLVNDLASFDGGAPLVTLRPVGFRPDHVIEVQGA